MKFGLFGGALAKRGSKSTDSQGYGPMVEVIQAAEALGFSSVFLVEHHFTGEGQVSASINLLTYIAAKTSTIRLGTGVTILPWHNPVLVAEQAVTLDLLSGGRLDFGIGRGYREAKFTSFCMTREEAEERYHESLELILKSWRSDERFSHDGKYWRFKDIVVEPSCLQKPHPPLWTGAGTDISIERTAKAGLNLLLNQLAGFERTEERMEVWRKACAEAGRAFDPMEVGLTRGMAITGTDAEYDQAIEQRTQRVAHMASQHGLLPGQKGDKQPATGTGPAPSATDGALIGTPAQIIAGLERFSTMGIGHVLFLMLGNAELLRRFAAEVMPAFETERQPNEIFSNIFSRRTHLGRLCRRGGAGGLQLRRQFAPRQSLQTQRPRAVPCRDL